jgi:hypothetical protein|tara:strand:- start:2036 stop:2647 length:612 start_codon:yes stop_codon:yes gene_type:complete
MTSRKIQPRKIQRLDIFNIEDDIEDDTQIPNQSGSPNNKLQHIFDDSDIDDSDKDFIHAARTDSDIDDSDKDFIPDARTGSEIKQQYEQERQSGTTPDYTMPVNISNISRRCPAYAPPATIHEINTLYLEHVKGTIVLIVPSMESWSKAAAKEFQTENGSRTFRNITPDQFKHYINRHKFTAKLKLKDSYVNTYECTGFLKKK